MVTKLERPNPTINRDVEFNRVNGDEMEAPVIGIMAITAIFIFLVLLLSVFGSTNLRPAHHATPQTEVESKALQAEPFPVMPLPNSGPLPAPAPQD